MAPLHDVTQISIGRFHHFHLARQMERAGVLREIWTGYPKFKLRDESGVPVQKIRSYPWFQTAYMARGRLGLGRWERFGRELAWHAHETLDRHVARNLVSPTTLIALSGGGLHSGRRAQRGGGRYICDRGSSHIRYQDEILRSEFKRWNIPFAGVDARSIRKEEAEYELADRISVPSEFVRRSFAEKGVPTGKVVKIPYGARLDRFRKVAEPDSTRFRILWVGQVSIRKGFLYLLHAFQQLQHPAKELVVIGSVEEEIRPLLRAEDLSGITFRGTVSNADLPTQYSTAQVFVLPSIEEGLGMVQGEALACGCPVIASANTGAEDLFTDGCEGFIVPIRSASMLLRRLEQMAQDATLRERMSEAALRRVKALGGWDTYGDAFVALLHKL